MRGRGRVVPAERGRGHRSRHRRRPAPPRARALVAGRSRCMSAAAVLLGVLIQASPAPPPAVVEGHFPGSGGTRLFYRKVGTGPKVVVFLHGGPGSNFRGSGRFHRAAGEARPAVVLYDQRGSGLSDLETDSGAAHRAASCPRPRGAARSPRGATDDAGRALLGRRPGRALCRGVTRGRSSGSCS